MSERARDIMTRKNHDYSGPAGDDPFANFRRSESMGITSTGQAIMVRMTDKFSRLATFFEAGVLKVADETAEDSCLDLINYSIILAAIIREMRDEAKASCPVAAAPEDPKQVLQAVHAAIDDLWKRMCDGPGSILGQDNARGGSTR